MILEVSRFNIKNGVKISDFIEEAKKFQLNFVAKQYGFKWRRLAKSDNSHWVDIIEWDNIKNAENAMKKSKNNKFCNRWFSMIDMNSIKVEHNDVIVE